MSKEGKAEQTFDLAEGMTLNCLASSPPPLHVQLCSVTLSLVFLFLLFQFVFSLLLYTWFSDSSAHAVVDTVNLSTKTIYGLSLRLIGIPGSH